MAEQSSLTLELPKRTRERLTRLALRYGFSLEEFSRRFFEELDSEIPEESLEEYRNPQKLRSSIRRAVRDWRAGRVRRSL